MSFVNPYIEIAALNRVADLVQSGVDLPTALRMTSSELEEYYKIFYGEKVEKFDLTEWVNNGKTTP